MSAQKSLNIDVQVNFLYTENEHESTESTVHLDMPQWQCLGNAIFNQSVENAGVAFVKGAHERNEHFEKINKL